MKDEMPHKNPMEQFTLNKILVKQGKKLIVIRHEATVWKSKRQYYLYALNKLEAVGDNYQEIKKHFNDYFNRRK